MTMIERVAEALFREKLNREGEYSPTLAEASDRTRAAYAAQARAAIEALRTPSEAMGAQGLVAWQSRATPPIDPDHLAGNPSMWMKPVWRAMIDAALAERDGQGGT